MLEVDICGVKFKNPVIAASGTFGFGREYAEYIDLNRLGGISTKGLTFAGKDGNTGIRIYETPAGIMNSIGLQNPSRLLLKKIYLLWKAMIHKSWLTLEVHS